MHLLQGIVLGFLIAAPVGPVGVLCIQRTLNRGRLSGFVSGLGAAVADAFYGAVAAYGLVMISRFLIDRQFVLRLIGVIFLLYFGFKSYYSKAREVNFEEKESGTNIFTDFISTFFLTITNPMSIIAFSILFTGVGFGFRGSSNLTATLLVVGVFLGSALCWFLLSFGAFWARNHIRNFS